MNNLSPEEKAVGKDNFNAAIASEHLSRNGVNRRDFMKGAVAAGVVSGAGLGAMYFNYSKVDKPVRIGIIGTGDEGGVLIGALNPNYVEVAAIADIRPYNKYRAFHGDWSSENAAKVRPGLIAKYEYSSEDDARKHIKVYDSYLDLIAAKDELGIEGVIIALPLHLHADASIRAMRAGLHVLTEKLMAHSVAECKEMARTSKETNKLCATGHQRHYSILYDNAVDCIRNNLIGDIHHIRAQWHRQADTWSPLLPGDEKLIKEIAVWEGRYKDAQDPKKGKLDQVAKIGRRLAQLKQQLLDANVVAENYGYQSKTLPHGHQYTPLEELIRWRLWERTGGGLMAELGSHQLDAAGIFVSAMLPPGQKALPLTVQAVGGRHVLGPERECEDHVYCMYEYPGKGYEKDKNKKIVVTYSSINGNGFGGYGEVVLGTKGTLLMLTEQEALLFKDADTKTTVGISKKDGSAILDTTQSGAASAALGKAATDGPPSRGYTEEIEHWAWCIRNPAPENQPKCHPKVAMADAVIALTTNIAIRNPAEKSRIEFDPKWFDIDDDATPEGDKPDLSKYS